eukprot:PhM_4_TR3336/c0_g1_i1/m.84130
MSEFGRLQAENGLNVNASPWVGGNPMMAHIHHQQQQHQQQYQQAVAVAAAAVQQQQPSHQQTPPPGMRSTPTPAQSTPQPMFTAPTVEHANSERSVCKFFLQGGCIRGAGCSYLHELPKDSTLSAVADSSVTGIVFNVNAKNTFTAMQRQSSVDPSPSTGSTPNIPAGDGDGGMGYYDAAYNGNYGQVPMWGDGGDYHDMSGLGYPQGYGGDGGYYNEPMYPQHSTPPPQQQYGAQPQNSGGYPTQQQQQQAPSQQGPHPSYAQTVQQGMQPSTGGYGNGALYTGAQHQQHQQQQQQQQHQAPQQQSYWGNEYHHGNDNRTPPTEPMMGGHHHHLHHAASGSRHVFESVQSQQGTPLQHHHHAQQQHSLQPPPPVVPPPMQQQQQQNGPHGYGKPHVTAPAPVAASHHQPHHHHHQQQQQHGVSPVVHGQAQHMMQHSPSHQQPQQQPQPQPQAPRFPQPTRNVSLVHKTSSSHWADRHVSAATRGHVDAMVPEIMMGNSNGNGGRGHGNNSGGMRAPLNGDMSMQRHFYDKQQQQMHPHHVSNNSNGAATGGGGYPQSVSPSASSVPSTGSAGGGGMVNYASKVQGTSRGRGYGGHAYHV